MTTPSSSAFGNSLRELTRLVTQHRELVWELSKREITERHSGHALGMLWTIVTPLISLAISLAIYIVVFTFIFRGNLAGAEALNRNYPAFLMSGLLPWLGISEILGKSTSAISAQASLVKQVVFPVEVLPVAGVVATLVTQGIFMVLLVLYILISGQSMPATMALLPALFLVHLLLMCGMSYFLSSLAVYFRDLRDIVSLIMAMGLYLTPALYPPPIEPGTFYSLLKYNPFSHVIWCFQDLIYFGRIAHPLSWIALAVMTLFSVTIGYAVFRRLKPGFGSAL
jgi:lipopolysaccharide transport system permease protein